MLLPKFEYHEPSTIEEALHLLSELGGNAKVLAGGTDLLVRMKQKVDRPSHVISVARVPGLEEIIPRNGHGVTVGAGMTAAALSRSELLMDRFTPLALAASRLGAPMIRNRATIGGNLVNARPAADLPPPCMVLNASLKLKSLSGERDVPIMDFFRGPGETVVLQHTARSREPFARGALLAAKWIVRQPPGFYTMQNLIDATDAESSEAQLRS